MDCSQSEEQLVLGVMDEASQEEGTAVVVPVDQQDQQTTSFGDEENADPEKRDDDQVNAGKPTRPKKGKHLVSKNPYLDDEAKEVPSCSPPSESATELAPKNDDDDEEEESEENLDEYDLNDPFIADDHVDVTAEEMRNYVQDVHKARYADTEETKSQLQKAGPSSPGSGYERDSFCVDNDVVEYLEEDPFEESMKIAKLKVEKGDDKRETRSATKKKLAKEKPEGKKERKRIVEMNESSSSEENV